MKKKIKVNGKILEVNYLRTEFEQALGLMFSITPKILLFHFKKEKRVVFHMFFVFFPIYLVLLNSSLKVIEIKKLFPFEIYKTKNKILYALEIPVKIYNKLDLKIKKGIKIML